MADPVTLATVQELSDWIGEPIPANSAEAKRAALCLRAASALVRKESGRTWLQDNELVADLPDEVRMVTLYAASRVYDNRNAQTQGGIDDWQEGWKVDESGAYLTASERRQLSAYRSTGLGGLATVATTRVTSEPAPGWVPTETAGVVFPWY